MTLIDLLRTGQNFLALSCAAEEWQNLCEFQLGLHTQVTVWSRGIISFEPLIKTNKDIVLSSGIHGNETAPIELCDEMISDILQERIKVQQRILFIFGNLHAIELEKRFVEENLNRLFGLDCKGASKSYEKHRAKQIEKIVEQFYMGAPQTSSRSRLHYDLHTAIRDSKYEKFAVYPFLHGKSWDKYQLRFLLACGVNTILLSVTPSTTFSYFTSSKMEAHSFTIELGKVSPFGQNDMAKFKQVNKCLRSLICGLPLELKPYQRNDFRIFKVNQVILKQQNDFILSFADDLANFSSFKKGELLAQESGKQYFALENDEAIVFPNANVARGQRALLTVIPTVI